jgi:hypothetical protein
MAPGDFGSPHAGVVAGAEERQKLERLPRNISRLGVAEKRLPPAPNGNVRYHLNSPYRDGMTHVIFEPLDFIARLAVLLPEPRVNLTGFHLVFAPNSKYRARLAPAKRGRGGQHPKTGDPEEPPPAERKAAMIWAQCHRWVFGIDIQICLDVSFRADEKREQAASHDWGSGVLARQSAACALLGGLEATLSGRSRTLHQRLLTIELLPLILPGAHSGEDDRPFG